MGTSCDAPPRSSVNRLRRLSPQGGGGAHDGVMGSLISSLHRGDRIDFEGDHTLSSDTDHPGDPGQVTRLLHAWRDGDAAAADRLIRLVYDELHAIAEARMRGEAAGHTLQSTALVHEAYVRLAGADISWTDRKHFFAAAARAMRRVLTDHARARRTDKRGGELARVTLANVEAQDADDRLDLVALDEAIDELAAQDSRKASAVELHYYAGLSYEEIAEALDISPATVHRDLRMARAWLLGRLR